MHPQGWRELLIWFPFIKSKATDTAGSFRFRPDGILTPLTRRPSRVEKVTGDRETSEWS